MVAIWNHRMLLQQRYFPRRKELFLSNQTHGKHGDKHTTHASQFVALFIFRQLVLK